MTNLTEPYFIAELNTSHFGDIEIAKAMVNSCKSAGVDCVKFQSWSEETLYADSFYKENPISKRFFKKYALSEADLNVMLQHCRNIGIGFSSTPYSESEVDFLVNDCKADFIKVASMELNNPDFLDYIARKHVRTILSTGMGTIEEIKRAVDIFKSNEHKQLTLLHCVSIYPCPADSCNLHNIRMLKDEFPDLDIGYSDHTVGFEAAIASVALGARVIEKHFTLDNTKMGFDNQMATQPDEFKNMIDHCRLVSKQMGNYNRILTEEEIAQRKQMRRSVVAAHSLQKGHILKREDVVFKRPGTGISPDHILSFLGRPINQKIEAGDIILVEALD